MFGSCGGFRFGVRIIYGTAVFIKLFSTQNGKLIELVTRSFFRLTLSIWNHAPLP